MSDLAPVSDVAVLPYVAGFSAALQGIQLIQERRMKILLPLPSEGNTSFRSCSHAGFEALRRNAISFTMSHSFALQLAVPHNDEWTRFARTLVEIRANRADSEEEGTVELSA